MQFRDLSARAKLRVTGADRIRFLNGQTTNDVRRASAQRAQESCVLNTKGFLEAHLFLFAAGDAIYIDADEALRQLLLRRLERYIISDDVVIEDVTEQFALFHLVGEPALRLENAEFFLRADRLGLDGFDLWVNCEKAEAAKAVVSQSYRAGTEEDWERARIERGIPRWGAELTPEIMPPEANLETRAIDYEKGCYIGQEVISRLKMSGQTRQRLCGLVAHAASTLRPGMTLHAQEKPVGRITSAVFSQRFEAPIALGFVKRGFTTANTELHLGDSSQSAVVRLVALPFCRD